MKKKILHVPYGRLSHGGVSSVIFSILENLHEQFGFDSVVFNPVCDRELEFLQYGNLHRIPCYSTASRHSVTERLFRPFVMFRGIFRLCRREKYDVVHCHNGPDEGICLFAARCAGVPVRIAHSHNTPSPERAVWFVRAYRAIMKGLINKNATTRVGCSEQACSSFFGNVPYTVIVNAVDLKKFDLEKRTPPNDSGVRFVHVGRYCFQKNQKFVIQVFSKVHEQLPDSTLCLVGYGEDKKMLSNIIDELGLSSCISLLPGDQVDIEDVFAKGDIMIFPSVFEGFGIVLIEAQALGCYCFASEAIQNEADAGLLEKLELCSSASAWADRILRFIEHPPAVNDCAVREKLSNFDVQTVVKQYAAIYNEDQ